MNDIDAVTKIYELSKEENLSKDEIIVDIGILMQVPEGEAIKLYEYIENIEKEYGCGLE